MQDDNDALTRRIEYSEEVTRAELDQLHERVARLETAQTARPPAVELGGLLVRSRWLAVVVAIGYLLVASFMMRH